MTVGIDLTDSPARAVAVDAHGAVASRAEQPLAADHAAVARALHKALIKPAAPATARVGVAMLYPGDALPDAVAGAVGGHPVGIDAGAACALAEAWCGADAVAIRAARAAQLHTS